MKPIGITVSFVRDSALIDAGVRTFPVHIVLLWQDGSATTHSFNYTFDDLYELEYIGLNARVLTVPQSTRVIIGFGSRRFDNTVPNKGVVFDWGTKKAAGYIDWPTIRYDTSQLMAPNGRLFHLARADVGTGSNDFRWGLYETMPEGRELIVDNIPYDAWSYNRINGSVVIADGEICGETYSISMSTGLRRTYAAPPVRIPDIQSYAPYGVAGAGYRYASFHDMYADINRLGPSYGASQIYLTPVDFLYSNWEDLVGVHEAVI